VEDTVPENNILVAIDGSGQAMDAVQYVAAVFPARNTRVVFFHVSEPMSDLFGEMKTNQYYQAQLPRMRNWLADEQKHIAHYMEEAASCLAAAGFDPDHIETKIKARELDVARDIIKESYGPYDAVVVGRTGESRFKDFFKKSAPIKQVSRIKHIPVIVVGGAPGSKRICIGFDGSESAMKGVTWAAMLLGGSDCHIQLLSLLSHKGRFWIEGQEYFLPDDTNDAFEKGCEVVAPHMNKAKQRLIKAGFAEEQISVRIEITKTNPAMRIVNEVLSCGFGSVVDGRMALVGFFEEIFVGRVSEKVLKKADNVAVWIT
jgi:nucleotide-binding universal stress UspA family protein